MNKTEAIVAMVKDGAVLDLANSSYILRYRDGFFQSCEDVLTDKWINIANFPNWFSDYAVYSFSIRWRLIGKSKKKSEELWDNYQKIISLQCYTQSRVEELTTQARLLADAIKAEIAEEL
jgi:hypothetical protein